MLRLKVALDPKGILNPGGADGLSLLSDFFTYLGGQLDPGLCLFFGFQKLT